MMNYEVYKTIDDILGSKDKRFFSNGFKNITHIFNDVSINPRLNKMAANCSAVYPENWSVKKNGTKLKPHLSTLDIMVFAFCLDTFYINYVYQLSKEQVENIWIRKVTIKAGNEPKLELDDIAIHTRFISTKEDSLHEGRYSSTFSNEIAGFTIVIELDHMINSLNSEEGYYHSLDEAGSTIQNYCRSVVDRNKLYDISDICIDKNNHSLSSRVNISRLGDIASFEEGCEVDNGIYSIIDIFACASQQMQALIYTVDNIQRKNSNNLWMRKVEIEYNKPVSYLEGFTQFVHINKSKTLRMKNSTWQIADLKCSIDSPLNPICVNVSLAHEIPETDANTELYLKVS